MTTHEKSKHTPALEREKTDPKTPQNELTAKPKTEKAPACTCLVGVNAVPSLHMPGCPARG